MSHTQIFRILDASLNRAGEGLRVVEDYVRFVLDNPFLTEQTKSLRHDLAALAGMIPSEPRHAARDTRGDIGTQITTPSESRREDAWEVCAASLKRSEQSLRSIEEFGKLVDVAIAQKAEGLRYHLYTLEKSIDTGRLSGECLAGVTLCVLVEGGDSIDSFKRLVRDLVEAGVGMIQLRDKGLDDRDLVERAHLLVSFTRGSNTLAIINDRADVAAIVGADGVHLGQEDLTVKDARVIVGPRMLIGVSTHNIEQARTAVLDGANYLGAGPTFPSQTKNFDRFAGIDYLRQATAEIRLPTFAIAGITARNLDQVLAAGISRVAVASAVTAANKPASAAQEIMDMLNAASEPA